MSGNSIGSIVVVAWIGLIGFSSASVCAQEKVPPVEIADAQATSEADMKAYVEVVEQAAADIMPLDVDTDAGRLAIQSFVWPDQMERMERLRSALAIADEHPLHVERSDAGAWPCCR